LLNNMKHETASYLHFFSDEKIFTVDAMANPRNTRWIANNISEVPAVMKTKYPASVMVLSIISSQCHAPSVH